MDRKYWWWAESSEGPATWRLSGQALVAELWGVRRQWPEQTRHEGPGFCRTAVLTAMEFILWKEIICNQLKQDGGGMREGGRLDQVRGWQGFSALPEVFPLTSSQALLAQPSEPKLGALSGSPISSLYCPLTSGL